MPQLVHKLCTHFGDELLVMHVSGCACLLCLRQCVPLHINVVKNEDSMDDTSECVAQQIMAEVKALPKQRNYDLSSFTVSSTKKQAKHC